MKSYRIKQHISFIVLFVGLLVNTALTDDKFSLYINEFMAINDKTIKDESGQYEDWIEVYNSSDSSLSLSGLYLSDDPAELLKHYFDLDSGLIIPPYGHLILWADGDTAAGVHHLNFKLSGSGEHIVLYDSAHSEIIDQIEFVEQSADISYGRYPDGENEWFSFIVPTPGTSNISQGVSEKSGQPEFSMHSGYYQNPILLALSADIDSTIYYTLNGAVPTKESYQFQTPFYVNQTQVVRSRIIEDNKLPGDVVSHTFFINDSSYLPIFSLITDPANLYGTNGILSHRLSDWERPVYLQHFSEDGQYKYGSAAGIKIHAADGRKQQSFRLIARSKYDEDHFEHYFFSQKKINEFKTLILRNGGNDGLQQSTGTHLRDPLLHTLYRERNILNEMAAYEPVNVFLNGQYYGIYNLREREDKYYISGNRNYSDDIDLLERAFNYPGNRNAIEGDWFHYDSLKNFIDTHNMNIEANFQIASNMMNIENFIDYWIFEIFNGNFDWLSNNFKHWRPKTKGGRWKWILWDTDHGFGLPYSYGGIEYGNPAWNTLDWATGITGPRVDGGYNTKIIRGLLENEQFKNKFINHFADLLNTLFSVEYSISAFHKLRDKILPQVPRHLKKWNTRSYASWENSLLRMEDYLTARPDNMTDFIIERFEIGGTYKLALEVSPPVGGRIQLNSILQKKFPWEGKYFQAIPVNLMAVPVEGYRFSHWEFNGEEYDQISFKINPASDLQCKAFFVPETQTSVVINEINYNSHDDCNDGDWLELYNPGKNSVDLSGWFLKDESEKAPYVFPKSVILLPRNYLVLCEDSLKFIENHSSDIEIIGNFGGETGFGFSRSGERIVLRDNNGYIHDEVEYDDKAPWPEEADGHGYTLELKSPMMNNNDPENWASSEKICGTPGIKNDCYTSVRVQQANIPTAFSLGQNYPNPFNPSTTIKFAVPKPARIRIDIYDMLGRLIFTLADEQLSAGWYKVQWDGRNKRRVTAPSSIYIYRLTATAGDGQPFSAVRKMILIR